MNRIDQQDPDAFKQLTLDLMVAIKSHYMHHGASPRSVYGVLNALACCTAVVVAGTCDQNSEEVARHFFEAAMAAQLDSPMLRQENQHKGH